MVKYKIIFDGELEDDVFESFAAAEEYAGYLCGYKHSGAETLVLSNPDDYSMDDYDEAEWEIIEVDDI